jgi:cytochrome c oxidase subunit 1
MGPIPDTVFSLTTMLIAIPTGVKIFNWIATMHGGAIRFTTAMLFGIGLVGLFTIGGISGIMHSSPPADLQQTDTYFIVAHFHYVLFGGSMMGIFGGIYFYFPKMFGRMMNETLGKIHFWLMFIGMNLTFFPMHYAGMNGMPRRIYRYDAGQGFEIFNMMSTWGARMLAVGMIIFVYNFFMSRMRGRIAGNDPWGGSTLEWSIPSPPPDYNFAQLPNVTSRYPLWDLKAPHLTREVPHTREGDKTTHVEVAGKDAGNAHLSSTDHNQMPRTGAPAVASREVAERDWREDRLPSAVALGIPMPLSTIKPFFVAVGILVMFCGALLRSHEIARIQAAAGEGSTMPSVLVMLLGAVILVSSLYWWLLSPLEEHH